MTGDPSNLLTVDWKVTHDGGPNAEVLEFMDGQLAVTYGPMPKEVVGKFMLQRKQAVGEIFDRIIRRLNSGQDQTHQAEQVTGEAVPER
jgi:hypothetical protein